MKSARKDTFNFRYSQTEDVLALSKIVRFDYHRSSKASDNIGCLARMEAVSFWKNYLNFAG